MAKQLKRQENNKSILPILPSIILVLLLALITWYSHTAPSLNPPAVVDASAPDTVFSAERARAHLYELTREPRPVGSSGHERAGKYIFETLENLGLEPEVQAVTSFQHFQISIGAATVKNIMARIPGTNSTGTVVLAAHYDSAVHSYGATDAGNGVAAILETARALLSGPSIQNDVILLITDAEEPSLYGARAFVEQHPWAEETGIVLNAEGRGYYGPVIMFRTSKPNGNLIKTLGKTTTQPLGNSLLNDVFQYVPNNTDLTVFLDDGYAGMDFANVHGFSHYHTPLDNFQNADPRSLQHHGDYLLPLAKAFGNQNLTEVDESDRVYFTLPLLGFIHYSESWSIPISILAVFFVLFLFMKEYQHNRFTAKDAGWGFLYFIVCLLLLPITAMGIWYLVEPPEVEWFLWTMESAVYHSSYYLLAICLMISAIFILIVSWTGKKLSAAGLLTGPLTLFSVFVITTAIWMPGANYLFLWPLLFSAAGLVFLRKESFSITTRTAVSAILAAPILFLMIQVIDASEAMITLAMIAVPVIFLILTLGLLTLQLNEIAQKMTWKLPLMMGIFALGMILWGITEAGFNEELKKPNGINYIADAGEQEAWWYTLDPEPDEFTSQFLGADPEQETLPEWAPQRPFGFSNTPWISSAPLLRDDSPDTEILSESLEGDQRRIRLRITNPPETYVTVIQFREASGIRLLQINDRDIPDKEMGDAFRSQPLINYFAPDEDGIEIEFYMPEDEKPQLYLRSNIPGYPSLEDGTRPERPGYMMPGDRWRDITQLQRTVRLEFSENPSL